MDNHKKDPRNGVLVASHQPCTHCSSSDAMSIFGDGHTYCYSCEHYGPPNEANLEKAKGAQVREKPKTAAGVADAGQIMAIEDRALTYKTCEAFMYKTLEHPTQGTLQFANYIKNGRVVAQKIRRVTNSAGEPTKDFTWRGSAKESGLYGQEMWNGSSRKRIIVTEGEIDALSVYQATHGNWPVVSVPNGAASAKRDVQRNYEFLNDFEEVLICFDNDGHGQKAAEEVAGLFEMGKARIISLPEKDANDMLKANRVGDLVEAITHAKHYEPGGLVRGQELMDAILADDPPSDESYPFYGLDKAADGMRYESLICITAGIGTGKTTFITELAYSLHQKGHAVGMLLLEEPFKVTGRRIVGHHLNIPLQRSKEGRTQEEINKATAEITLGPNRVVLYNNKGRLTIDNLFERLAYMVSVDGVRFLFIDNLTALVAGSDERDERRMVDRTMQRLYTWARQNQVVIFLAVHLRRIDGANGHENGAEVQLSHLRGSSGVASFSDLVIALERNQQDEETKDITKVRIVKNRWTGQTGVVCELHYNFETGRMVELDAPEDWNKSAPTSQLETPKEEPEDLPWSPKASAKEPKERQVENFAGIFSEPEEEHQGDF